MFTTCFSRSLLLFFLAFCLGILSMGYQLVASRVLAPFFGSDYIVWSVLISTFLGSFTAGSFLGGWISGLSVRARGLAVGIVGAVATISLLFGEMFRRPILGALEAGFDSVLPSLMLGCLILFAPPVISLSSATPVAIELMARDGVPSGKAAGRLYGVSTVGNIAGVFLTALFLIPNFALPGILYCWSAAAALCFAAFTAANLRLWKNS